MTLVGVDEAGRGPLAGPVFAAAVWLTEEQAQELVALGLRDSKKMTPLRRQKVYARMRELGVVMAIAGASPRRIDRVNILRATLGAMAKAVHKLPFTPDGVVVDGNQLIPGLNCYQQSVIGGDDLYPQISAASVAAKVTRDWLMDALARRYPHYGFEGHKGYGTAAHRQAIRTYGPCPAHRRSFKW